MGHYPSVGTIPSYTPAARGSFATLLMSKSDRIRLLSFPSTIVDAVQEIIQSSWPRGIQNVRQYNGWHEFKLRGRPWSGNTDEATLGALLTCRILALLFSHGWVLTLSTDISKRMDNKDAMIFRHQQPAPKPCEWLGISFRGADLLHFVDAPTALVQALAADLSLVMMSHKPYKLQDVYEFKICGQPWSQYGNDEMLVWKLAVKLMEALEDRGFRVYTSINQKGGSHALESDTWYCCRREGWVSGAPVYDS